MFLKFFNVDFRVVLARGVVLIKMKKECQALSLQDYKLVMSSTWHPGMIYLILSDQ